MSTKCLDQQAGQAVI